MRNIIFLIGLLLNFSLILNPSHATSSNLFAPCTLVPFASFDDNGSSTAVGLTSQSSGVIHWHWFDQDGIRLDSNSFNVNANHLTSFVLLSAAPSSLTGVQGFLLFCLDSNNDGDIDSDDGNDLAANAFHVKASSDDVVYLPTVSVFASDIDSNNQTISGWNNAPIVSLPTGADSDDNLYLQYAVNGTAGDGELTTVYIFSSEAIDNNLDVTLYGPNGSATTTTTFVVQNDHLNVLDLEQNSAFLDVNFIGSGNIRWQPSSGGNVFAFSVVESEIFNAAQTLLGNVGSTPADPPNPPDDPPNPPDDPPNPPDDPPTNGGWDLVVESIALSDSVLGPNQHYTVTATIRNIGDQNSPANIDPNKADVLIYLSEDTVLEMPDLRETDNIENALMPNEAVSQCATVQGYGAGRVGSFSTYVCITTGSGEADATNNCSSVPTTISTAEPRADVFCE